MSDGREAVAGIGADAMLKALPEKHSGVLTLVFSNDVMTISYAANITDAEILAVIERFRMLLQQKATAL